MDLFNRNNVYALIIGELCFLFLFFLAFNITLAFSLNIPKEGLPFVGIALMFPILAFVFVQTASYFTKYFTPALQIAKFILVGILNTLVDIGIFNLLAALFPQTSLIVLGLFKAISFLTSVTNSYAWNKTWVFEGSAMKKEGLIGEFFSFVSVSVGGLLINITVFVATLSIIGNIFTILPSIALQTIAALVASFSSLLWNFLGYKLLVFKK